MKWSRVGKYGMRSGNYSVGKVFLDGASLYELWFNNDLIKTCNDFDECKAFAEQHRRNHGFS